MYGRLVFGASAIVFGIDQMLWRDSSLWGYLHPLWAPLAAIIAWCITAALVIGGIAIMFPRTARPASVVLGAVYALSTVAVIPAIVVTPGEPGNYVNFGEQLGIFCGALAVYATTEPSLGRVARIIFGLCTLSFAWAQVVYFKYTASLVPTWIPPSQDFWTILTTVAFALAGIAMLINIQARLALRLTALMIALFGILVWVPKLAVSPRDFGDWNEISSNYLMGAASWLIAELRVF